MSTTSDVIVILTAALGTGAAAVIDLRTRRVPNPLTASFAAVGIALAATGFGRVSVLSALVGCLVGLFFMLPGHLYGATGAGDVKLFAAAGTLLGPESVMTAFLATAIAGGLLALSVAAQRGRVLETAGATARLVASGGASTSEIEHATTDNRFAYAPAIAIGVTLAALAG